MQLYRNILKQGLKISWQNKYLWFFGLFAALLGNTNEYEILFGGLSNETGQNFFAGFSRIAETGIFSKQSLSGIGQIMAENPLSLLLLLIIGLVMLALSAFLVWLMIISQAALVNNSAKIITNKKHNFQNGAVSGMKNFWPVFGLNAISKFVVYLVFALLGLSFIATLKPIYIFIFIIFIPIAIALSFMIKYAIAYVVIRGSGFKDSIKQGWQLFARNWLISLEMAFLLFAITFLVGFALIIVFGSLNTIFAFLTVVFGKFLPAFGFWLFVVIRSLFILAITVFIGAILTSWQIASWTGLFIELTGKGGTSRIARMFGKLEFKSKK